MVQMLKNIIFLLAPVPWVFKLMAAAIFTGLGFWMGYLIWKVTGVENERLVKLQSRLRDEVAALKAKLESRGSQAAVAQTEAKSGKADDLTRLIGITAEIAAKLNESGIRTYEQLAELEVLSEQERRQFAATFGLPEINLDRWRWAWAEKGTQSAGNNPPSAALEPVDDLTAIRGITPELASRMNRQGIRRFAQIAAWTEEDARQYSVRLGVGRQIIDERWVEQCRRILNLPEPAVETLDPAILDQLFVGEPVRLDSRLGVVYTRRPELMDDLQRIDGVGPMLEQELHRLGVFRFKQVALWTPEQVKEFGARLSCFPDRMERDKLVEQARLLHEEFYKRDTAWDVAEPPPFAYQQVIDEVFVHEPVSHTPPFGIVYNTPPVQADDLGRIEGLTPGAVAELGRLGVYRYQQIAYWSEADVAGVASWLSIPADRIYREKWIPQARRLAEAQERVAGPSTATPTDQRGLEVLPDPEPVAMSTLRSMPPVAANTLQASNPSSDPTFEIVREPEPIASNPEGAELDLVMGYVFRAGRPGLIDDLKLIRGVGPAEESKLQAAGIFRFWQIAGWTPSQSTAVAERCHLGTRIDREKWIWQASKLAILSDASQKDFYRARTDVDAFAVVAQEFVGEEVRLDRDLGILYPEAPLVVDSLTLIQGVDPALEVALQQCGIYRFKQVGAWSDGNVGAVAARLGVEKSRIEREKWVSQAVNLQRVIYAASPVWAEDEPSLEGYGYRAAEVFTGEPVHLSEDLGILYAKRPSQVDALSKIRGVDDALEARLHASGVYRFRQIANWSARNVVAFAEWFGCPPDRIYRDRWIAQAAELDRTLVPEAPVPAPVQEPSEPEVDPFEILANYFAGEADVRVDRRAGVVYGDRPEIVDDLTLISGVTPELQAQLNETGIYRFKQIRHWSPRNSREVAGFAGIDPYRVGAEQWVEQAGRLEKEFYSASPTWSMPRPSLADYERRMHEAYADDAVGADEELGILYAGVPALYDDLKKVHGISEELEGRLNATGVYRYKQIADWADANVKAFGAWLGIPSHRIYQQRWIGQAAQLVHSQPLVRLEARAPIVLHPLAEVQFEALAREFGDEPGARIDRQFGIVYDDAPLMQDDLKRLPGVTAGMEEVFHHHGVFRFKQVAAWTPGNEVEFARVLGMSPEQFRAARWPEHARGMHEQTYRSSGAWTVRRPALEAYQQRIAEQFPNEPVRADEELGILYVRRPVIVDDLTRIQGIEPVSAARLHASGVYRFKQVANWSDTNVETFARWIGVPVERVAHEDWVGQSAELAKQAAEVKPLVEVTADPLATHYAQEAGVSRREDLGHVYQEAPKVQDDLTRIHGIDSDLAQILRRNGIYRFWQIALWSTDVVDIVSGTLDLGNRIKRERWRPQARVLATLGFADEEGRFVAGEADHFAIIEKEYTGESGVRADPRFGIVYDQRPVVVDDLCKISGITFAIEEELHRHGVYRFKQIGHWSDANVAAFAEACGLRKEEIETGKWIPQARWQHLRVYGQATKWAEPKPSVDRFEELLGELFPGESVRVDEKFGFVYIGRPRYRDDLSQIRGVTEALARRLTASGIHSFRQVAWWSDANVRSIGKKLGFQAEQVYRGSWIAQAAKLDEERPEEEPEVVAVSEDPETPGFEHGLVTHPELGLVYTERPAIIDDLKVISGVGPKLERMLNGLGIYRFTQVASWDEAQVAAVSSRMHFRERIQRERWVEQARELAAWRQAEHQESFFAPAQLDQIAIVERELHDEPGARVDPYVGIVFDQAPLVADDLTAIDGIGKRMERELQESGIYRYVQLANWTDGNVAHIAENLSCLKDRIERDKWIPQARRLHRETYSASRAWGVERPSLADYQARIEEEFPGEAVRPDGELGILYSGWPSHVDDLKEISGVDVKLERALNQMGVYCVKQIANWSVANVDAFAKQLGTSPQRIYRDRWILQASNLPCKEPLPVQPVYEGVDIDLRRVLSVQPGLEPDERLGFVYTERPVDVDALHLIKGLGYRLEQQINKLGVYRFRQIASWSDPQVEEFGSRLKIGNRIRSANWVGQAREWAALSEEERRFSFVAPSVVDQDAALEIEFSGDAGVRIDEFLGIVYDRVPPVLDDLNLINGIGAQMERELNELGVYRFKQIARWSDANVAEFARRLFCQKERIERDKWIPQAKRLLKVVYAASLEWGVSRPGVDELDGVIRAEFSGQRVRADKDHGIVYTERPSRGDDLKEIPGISSKIEQDLNAAGVWRFLQIARWAPSHVESFAGRLQIPADRIYRDRWIPNAQQLAGSAPAPAPVAAAAPAPAPTPVPVVPASVSVVEKPVAPVAPSRAAAPSVVAAEPAVVAPPVSERATNGNGSKGPVRSGHGETRGSVLDPALVIDPDLGPVYRDRPSKIDDLQLIVGVGPVLERRLHACGVYRYRQIADWTPENVENYALRLDVGERIQREEWVKQSVELAELVEAEESDELFVAPAWVDYNAVVRQHFAGETGLRVDNRWGIVYDQKPDWLDDLKQIDGIGPKLERVLNRHGVYQFRQISHWSDATVSVFAEALGVSKDRIDRGKWVPQARRLERETAPVETEWGDRQPGLAELQERAAREFTGEDIEVDESYGIVYVIRPDEVDNIKLVKGIGATFAERLHSVGVYRFKQIALWGDGNVEAFARLLGTHRHRIYREGWIRQAREMASANASGPRRAEPAPVERPFRGESRLEDVLRRDLRGEDAVVNPELGIIFRTPPREVDDLKKIRGIGQKLENSLNDHGVYQFRQIALWSRANAEEFSRRLECFADRMFRDQWIEQARRLHFDKYGLEV